MNVPQEEPSALAVDARGPNSVMLASVEIFINEHTLTEESPNPLLKQESDLPTNDATTSKGPNIVEQNQSNTEVKQVNGRSWKCPNQLRVKTLCIVLFAVTMVITAAVVPPVVLGLKVVRDGLTSTTNNTDSTNLELVNLTSIVCQEEFFKNGSGLCEPECGKHSFWPRHTERAINALFILGATVGTATGVVVITVSCNRRKRLLGYPSVFIVYQTLIVIVHNTIVLAGRIDATALFCKSRSLNESNFNSTPFCVISGMVFYYTISQLLIWWCFHVVSIFWGVKFPFHFQTYTRMGKIRYVHATLLISGVLLPLVPVLAPFAGQGYGFSFRYPPILCASFDTFILVCLLVIPCAVLVIIGIFALIGVFWTIIKERKLIQHKKRNTSLSHPEVKVLIIICFSLLWFSLAIIGFTIFGIRYNKLKEAKMMYYGCASFTITEECDRSNFEHLLFPILGPADTLHIALTLFPVVNLVYIIDIKATKKWLKTWSSKGNSRTSSTTSKTSSSTS